MKNRQNLSLILALSLALCVLLTGLSLAGYRINFYERNSSGEIVYDEELISFDTNWRLVALESRRGPLSSSLGKELSVPGFAAAGKGGRLVMENVLPASVTEGSYLAVMGSDSFIRVTINGEEVYLSPSIENNGHLTPLPGWMFIPLKSDYSAGTVDLDISYPYSYSSGMIPRILIGSHSEVLLYASYSSYLSMYVGVSVVILGALIFIFSLVNLTARDSIPGLPFLGIYVAAVGLILVNSSSAPRMDGYGYYTEFMLSNLLLRTLPMIHSLYMYLGSSSERRRRIFLVLFLLSMADFIVSLGLHMAGVWDLTASLWAAMALVLLELGISFFFEAEKLKSSGRFYAVLTLAGIGAFAAGTAADILGHYTSLFPSPGYKTLSALVFAVCETIAVVALTYNSSLGSLRLANELTKSRVKLMISQIQPHFVYNALNAIRAMIKKEPDRAYDMVYDFAGYLRYNINALSDIEIIPFSEEMKHIKVYVDIEKERFRERVNVIYELEDMDFGVPPLSVQPFVENAIKHGICKKPLGGTVTVRSFEEEDCFVVEVIDDGVGFDTSLLASEDKRGVGLNNSIYRLKSLAGAEVDIKSHIGEGTKVKISFPKDRRRPQ